MIMNSQVTFIEFYAAFRIQCANMKVNDAVIATTERDLKAFFNSSRDGNFANQIVESHRSVIDQMLARAELDSAGVLAQAIYFVNAKSNRDSFEYTRFLIWQSVCMGSIADEFIMPFTHHMFQQWSRSNKGMLAFSHQNIQKAARHDRIPTVWSIAHAYHTFLRSQGYGSDN